MMLNKRKILRQQIPLVSQASHKVLYTLGRRITFATLSDAQLLNWSIGVLSLQKRQIAGTSFVSLVKEEKGREGTHFHINVMRLCDHLCLPLCLET